MINPGSVGQSRDGDWRASFAIYDSDRSQIEFHRAPFDRLSAVLKARELIYYEPQSGSSGAQAR
jgi:diadenosine tetraphosphatase ApaH/serine/threonine PP2A family protein phosphatase